jgi:hypothetical protein
MNNYNHNIYNIININIIYNTNINITLIRVRIHVYRNIDDNIIYISRSRSISVYI